MDIEDLKRYQIIRKTSLDLAREKISDSISKKFSEVLGLNDLYHLGCIAIINMLLNNKYDYTKAELADFLVQYKSIDGLSKDVIALIDEVIKEHAK